MIKKPRIWISMMVFNQKNHVEEICQNLSWCNGIVAVDHFSDDGTYEILNENKKAGVILQMPWMNLHYLSMTACLQNGVIRPGDWVYALDSQERVHPEFVANIHERILDWESKGIGCIFWGKPLIFKKTLGMAYFGNPHCFPTPLEGQVLNVQDESTVVRKDGEIHLGKYLINKKDLDNTMIFHGSKYYFYEMSNQVDMFYGKYGQDVVQRHQSLRKGFLLYLESLLLHDTSIFNFLHFIKNEMNNLLNPQYEKLINYIDFEFPLTDAIRLKVLGQHRDEILKNRHNWSFRRYLLTKDLTQENTGYKGTVTKYEEGIIQ